MTALFAGLALTGCSAIGIEKNTFESGPLPALNDDRVDGVLATIDTTLNEANAARDPELLATLAADPLLAIDVAGYALDATADPENVEPLPVVAHADPTAFVPRFEGYPQWFVTASSIRPETPLRLEVYGRESAAAPWITSLSTDLLADVEFPELALDDAGYVVVATTEPPDLPTAVEDVAASHAALLSAGEATEGPSLAEDPWTTARQTTDAQRGEVVADAAEVQVAYEVTSVLPQALKTADGGTLVFYALAEEVIYQVQPTFFLQLDEATAALAGTDEITTSLTERWGIQLAVYVPPEADGTARVIAARVDRIGLTGT